jgi:hypothetical protein
MNDKRSGARALRQEKHSPARALNCQDFGAFSASFLATVRALNRELFGI